MASYFAKIKERRQNKQKFKDNDISGIEYDLDLLADIQTKGGRNYKSDFYSRTGTGYETCITIYETPTDVEDFWLGQIMTMDNTICTVDLKTKEKTELKSDIKGALDEYIDRMHNDKDAVSRNEATEGYQELQDLLREVRNGGEAIKEVILRIYVSGRTTAEVDDRIDNITTLLNSFDFKGTVYMNEQKYDHQALTMSLSQQDTLLPRIKKDIPASTIAAGVPFHSVSLLDPYGVYFGSTETGGNVLLDLYHKDRRRTSYDGVLVGSKGAGKSHTLKKILKEEAVKGFRIRTIDSTGEFKNLVNVLGGKTISLDGTDGLINPLDVQATAVEEKVDDLGQHIQEVDEATSFTQHLLKLGTFYQLMNSSAEPNDLQLFRLLVTELYKEKGLWEPSSPKNKITGLPSEKYPTFSELLDYLQNKLYTDIKEEIVNEKLNPEKVRRYQAIEMTLIDLISSNGRMFDGHTTLENFNDNQIINLSIRQLNSMSDEVKKAQLFNVMTLLFNEMIYFGSPQFQAYNRGELSLEDAVRYRLIFDEAHNLISATETDAPVVDICEKFIREDRKYFAGFLFASQDIKDFIPDGSKEKNINKVKTLFSQTTYRFIMRQDTSNVEKLSEIFTTELSESELGQIPQLDLGQCILNIAGLRNIKFSVETTEEENELFGGGA